VCTCGARELTFDESTHERWNEWLSAKAAKREKNKTRKVEKKGRTKVGVKDNAMERKRREKKERGNGKEKKERENGKGKERASEENSVTGVTDCYILPPLRMSSVL
jgi:hypothetical protein